jgi:hypothetical protein
MLVWQGASVMVPRSGHTGSNGSETDVRRDRR